VLHPRLAAMAEHLEQTGWAAELCAPDWTLVWVSSQLRRLLGEDDDAALGIGEHFVASRLRPVRERFLDPGVMEAWLDANVPHMIGATPGGVEAIAALLPEPYRARVQGFRALDFPAWTALLEWPPIGRIRYFGLRPRGLDGEEYGTMYIYGSSLPASLLALVARGNQRMFERMAALVEPGRREAALLFADLQASTSLSRHLASAAYFELLTSLLSALDSVVIRNGGIVGKHAGDGATAFFLPDDLGSRSTAARAAIEAARDAATATARTAQEEGIELALNVGLHWGGTLYMGQLVTDGRLEVTALGDEVNECARVQETARDGAILASKPLLERLDPVDAARVGVDPMHVQYRALAELPGATEKALRDAGVLAVTDVRAG
jgi:class 3 adenylate cyclase